MYVNNSNNNNSSKDYNLYGGVFSNYMKKKIYNDYNKNIIIVFNLFSS